MNLTWITNSDGLDWDELSNLYKIAPLGDKKPKDLMISGVSNDFRSQGLTFNFFPSLASSVLVQ